MGLGVIASKRGVFNFAHGEFLLLGANAVWRAQETGLPVWLGMVAPPSVVTLTSHADVVAHRRQAGRPMPQFDAQIAAADRCHRTFAWRRPCDLQRVELRGVRDNGGQPMDGHRERLIGSGRFWP